MQNIPQSSDQTSSGNTPQNVPTSEPVVQNTAPIQNVTTTEQSKVQTTTNEIKTVPSVPLNNDQNERLWGGVSYIPMLALLALIVKPNSPYIKLHGRQGLLMFIIFFLSLFLYFMIEPLGPLLAGLIQLGLFVIGIYSAFMAFTGNWWKIPVLGDIAESIPVEFLTRVTTQALTGDLPSNQNNSEEVKPPPNNSTQV